MEDRRIQNRIHPHHPLKIDFTPEVNPEVSSQGLIGDISRGGMYINTDDKLTSGYCVTARIPGEDLQNTISVEGMVVRSDEHGMAVKFSTPGSRVKELIESITRHSDTSEPRFLLKAVKNLDDFPLKTRIGYGMVVGIFIFNLILLAIFINHPMVGAGMVGMASLFGVLLASSILSKTNMISTDDVQKAIVISLMMIFFALLMVGGRIDTTVPFIKTLAEDVWLVMVILVGLYISGRAVEKLVDVFVNMRAKGIKPEEVNGSHLESH
ncbi:MAG TPA: PilZ domain-containing protein [Deltaproteobacteria bacterium]|nr:PilZ domain-containing protein [Deltaproteobacteria bacterium]